MLIRNVSILLGKELEFVKSTSIRISNGKIKEIKTNLRPNKNEIVFDGEGLLMIPGLINSHTHIGDSIGKDIGIEANVETKIHPVTGFKHRILKNTEMSHLEAFVRTSCLSMIRKGITTFIDFREGGLAGINLLRNATLGTPIRPFILGRIEYYQDRKEIKNNLSIPDSQKSDLKNLVKSCHGLGISGPNEFSNSTLKYFSS